MPGGVCTPCGRHFVSQEARQAHINNSPRHPHCVPCNRGFVDDHSKLQHLRSSPKHNYCIPCEREFKTQMSLHQHLQSAAVHRAEYQSSYASEADWETDSYPGLLPTDDSDAEYEDEWTRRSDGLILEDEDDYAHSEADSDAPSVHFLNDAHWSWYADGADGADENTLVRLLQNATNLLGTTHYDSSSDESSSAGEDGTYLDATSDDDQDTSSEDVDSDFLEHTSSSDSDDDASDAPPELVSDVNRSTITYRPLIRSPTQEASTSRASVSPSTTASSSTLPTHQTLEKPISDEKHAGKSRTLASGYTCPLCLEQDGEPALELTSVKCGHVFCTPCITRALKKRRECPVCRARARAKDLRRIYLSF